jgi:hypothetical protein
MFSTAALEAGDLDLLLGVALGVGHASGRWLKLRHFLGNYTASFAALMRKADACGPGELERFQIHTDRAFLAWRELHGGGAHHKLHARVGLPRRGVFQTPRKNVALAE